jgi:hypothetical protein
VALSLLLLCEVVEAFLADPVAERSLVSVLTAT